MGRLYRGLGKRSLTADKVMRIKTMERATEAGPERKRTKLGDGLDLVASETTGHVAELPVQSGHQYCYAFQALLFTLAYAGSFKAAFQRGAPRPRS